MKKYLLILFLVLFVSCTSEVLEENNIDRERVVLQNFADEYLENSTPESLKTQDELNSEEEEVGSLREVREDRTSSSTTSSPQERRSVLIRVVNVDYDRPEFFDLGEDELVIEPEISTTNLDASETFEVAITARVNGERVGYCEYTYRVGDNSQTCEMSDMKRFGDYYMEIYADSTNKYYEQDEEDNKYYDNYPFYRDENR